MQPSNTLFQGHFKSFHVANQGPAGKVLVWQKIIIDFQTSMLDIYGKIHASVREIKIACDEQPSATSLMRFS